MYKLDAVWSQAKGPRRRNTVKLGDGKRKRPDESRISLGEMASTTDTFGKSDDRKCKPPHESGVGGYNVSS
jgi:hypothetical protein